MYDSNERLDSNQCVRFEIEFMQKGFKVVSGHCSDNIKSSVLPVLWNRTR
jgi:hypothetical protein